MKTVVVVVVVGCGPAWPTLLIEVIDITRPSKPRPINCVYLDKVLKTLPLPRYAHETSKIGQWNYKFFVNATRKKPSCEKRPRRSPISSCQPSKRCFFLTREPLRA
jgi:hypothetical protein